MGYVIVQERSRINLNDVTILSMRKTVLRASRKSFNIFDRLRSEALNYKRSKLRLKIKWQIENMIQLALFGAMQYCYTFVYMVLKFR